MSISPVTTRLQDSRLGIPVATRWVAATVVAVISAYTLALTIFVLPTNADVSWLFSVVSRLFDGERLHFDVIEVNPPFSILLYTPLVLLERATGLAAEAWLSIGLVAIALASLLHSARLLATADPSYRQNRFVWAIPAAFFVILFLFPDDFGQREQIGVIALLPWLALTCARDRDPEFRVGRRFDKLAAGIGAAIVVMIKPPYYVLAIAAPACFLAVRRKSLRPLFVAENLIGAMIVVFYIAYVIVFHRPFFDVLFELLVPIYLPFRLPLFELLSQPIALAFMATTTIIAAGSLAAVHRDVRIVFLSALGFVPAFLAMGKGWSYHALPFVELGLLALMLQLLRLGPLTGLPPLTKAGATLGLLFGLLLPAASHSEILSRWMDSGIDRRNREAALAIRQAVDNPTVFSISPWIQSAHPLVRQIPGRFVSRHARAWLIYNSEMLIKREQNTGRRALLEARRDGFIAEAAAELAEKRPDIVIYDEDDPVDFWAHLVLENPAIATELAKYRVLHRDGTTIYFIRADIEARP